MNDFDWNRARAFLVAAEKGSFSAAARALGVSQPTVGRQVDALERELGVTLIERVPRGIQLTPTGLELLEHIRPMSEAAAQVRLAAAGQSVALAGTICISASEVISAFILPPIIARIRQEYPQIELEVLASNQRSDLRRREADIAVRNFQPKDPELVAKKIREARARLYASAACLERLDYPSTPEDLSGAPFVGFDPSGAFIEGLNALGLSLTARNFPIMTENYLVHWELVKQGAGIGTMLEEIGDAEPGVQRLLPDFPPIPVPLWLVSHREVRMSRRVRVVFDLLAEALRSPGRREASPG